MGCDIHMCVEIRHNGEWYCGDVFIKNKFFKEPNIIGITYEKPDIEGSSLEYDNISYYNFESEYNKVPLWSDRDYDLFSILADVRNDGAPFISRPRGFPSDICKETRDSLGEDDYDFYHSASYFTLKEMQDWAATQPQDQVASLNHLIKLLEERMLYMCRYDYVLPVANFSEDIRIVFAFDS